MNTVALAHGKSSVKLTFILGAYPFGVIAIRKSFAFPSNTSSGFPDGRFTICISFQDIPILNPIPKALEHASLAAHRFAYEDEGSYFFLDLWISNLEKTRFSKRSPKRSSAFLIRSMFTRSVPIPKITPRSPII